MGERTRVVIEVEGETKTRGIRVSSYISRECRTLDRPMIRTRDLGTCIRRSEDIVAEVEAERGEESHRGVCRSAGRRGGQSGEIFACSSRLTETPGKFIRGQ